MVPSASLEETAEWPEAISLPQQILAHLLRVGNFLSGENETAIFRYLHSDHLSRIQSFVERGERIQMILPAFPAKSPNPEKTLGTLPDLGEVLALQKLDSLCVEIKQVYAPGAEVIICSDGRVFSDLVRVKDEVVNEYRDGIKAILSSFNLQNLRLYNLEDVFLESSYEQMRQNLVDLHADPLAQIRQRVIESAESRELFNGIHRFIFEDQLALDRELSRNRIRVNAKATAYAVIQRSNAWSSLVGERFPEALRLSIHPQLPTSPKLGIQLVRSSNIWGTPWHGVMLSKGGTFSLVKRAHAQQLGAQLMEEAYPYFSMGAATA